MKFATTATDFLRSKLLEPGWYSVKIIKGTEKVAGKEAKNPGQAGFEYDAIVSKGPGQGVPLSWSFWESAPGFAYPFWNSLLPPEKQLNEKNPEMPEFEAAIGKEIQVHVINDKYNNRYNNKVDDFKPLGR